MSPEHLPLLFPPELVSRMLAYADVDPGLVAERFDDPRVRAALGEAEVLVTGWGAPRIDSAVLQAAPNLRAVLHSAGSVKNLLAPECWDRGIAVSSAATVNALPVAEYTLAAILLAGKNILAERERYRARRAFTIAEILPDVGNFGRRVGIVGASRTGRRVIELLRPFDLRVAVADPYAGEDLGVAVTGLDELLADSDIVSLHAPATRETHHLIGRRELALMPDGAVLINTARGSLVHTPALVDELRSGRLSAVLDVTDPEPLPPDSPLFDLPNAFVTPHLAGSHGNELVRLGQCVVDELERLVSGRPLAYPVDGSELERAA